MVADTGNTPSDDEQSGCLEAKMLGLLPVKLEPWMVTWASTGPSPLVGLSSEMEGGVAGTVLVGVALAGDVAVGVAGLGRSCLEWT
jgi:hypothetical protein